MVTERGARLLLALTCCTVLLGGCSRSPGVVYAPLPPLQVRPVPAPTPASLSPETPGPLSRIASGEPVTLSARDVDVRALLPALAEAAGLSLVLGPDIQGRVSVNLVGVPALVALEMVLTEAELAIASGPPTPPFGQVVFYTLPVHIDEASAELIEARFGVSPEVARWIVGNRPPR